MTKDPITIDPATSIGKATEILRTEHIGGLPVTKGLKLVGIITESDVLNLLTRTRDLSEDLWLPSPLEVIEVPIRELMNLEKTREALSNISEKPVSSIMTEKVLTISPEDSIEDAARIMLKQGVNRLVVLENEAVAGIVTRADIIEGIAKNKEELE